MTSSAAGPSLKIVGLHVEGFRALRRVDWPTDGNGWGETVPDMVMVGGVNGSGKTTLLELIAEAAQAIFVAGYEPAMKVPATVAVAVAMELKRLGGSAMMFRWPSEGAGVDHVASLMRSLNRLKPSGVIAEAIADVRARSDEAQQSALLSTIADPNEFSKSDIPSVVYLPTDRHLAIPAETYKSVGKLNAQEQFYYRFTPPALWKDSLEALLYSARWADLNAKEEGHPERATHFESYAQAFYGFFGDAKRLVWEGGELFVRIADTGALHPLLELSSGEKQALILTAELYRRWRPGSLILIDEPELHFHTSWQTAFYTMLERWQKERGGQVIIATQSTHLFRIATPGTTVLLGGPLA